MTKELRDTVQLASFVAVGLASVVALVILTHA